jgi:uncharacterized membrane protein YecN with MAPEG domain
MLSVTSIVAALAVVFYIFLAARIIVIRRTDKVSLGAGTDKILETRIRQHGNFAEYLPLSLILLALAEIQNVPNLLLVILGAAIMFGRVAHWYGLENMSRPIGLQMRTYGMIATFTSMGVLAVILLITALF